MTKLKTGVAYHGNRMPSHARVDMKEISDAGMDVVVHMLSHNDWARHRAVMKDIFAMTEDAGLEVWVDNWGLGGSPGDIGYFLGQHPEAHMYFADGEMHPTQVCVNSPEYFTFVKDWLYAVREMGGKTIFWDEPFLPAKKIEGTDKINYTCTCPNCRKIFEEKYGHPMPAFMDSEAEAFRTDSLVNFIDKITTYANSLELTNACCVMLGENLGISLDSIDRICALPHLDNIGSDPYWLHHDNLPSVYEYVYNNSKKNVDIADKFGKDHNLWIQTYNNPRGREEEIIEATEACYDAGARTILAWGFHGSESNTYRAKNPERAWACTVEGFNRIRNMERDRILAENRRKYMK
ncbi:MAG: hypothetical protein IJX38_05305 [Clostridia bacterium]|nr:hypothetical protein [Clostridia bacterium]